MIALRTPLPGLVGVLLACFAGVAGAQARPEAMDWLKRIYDATQRLSYSGTFVYQQGERTESSRITRYVDGSGAVEKIVTLDGMPREIVRTRDTVRCYLPQARVLKVDRRGRGEQNFPALLPAGLAGLAEHYTLSLGDSQRVAGFDCQVVVLTPKDKLRYGHRLWADNATGMLLKAATFDAKGDTIEQFTFVQLEIGKVTRDRVRPSHTTRDWRVEDAGSAPANLAEAGWSLSAELPGFRKIVELKRKLRESQAVGQMVYSDGIAAVSVFIEPLQGRTEPVRPGLAVVGAINIYTREVADHVVTVVGEAPAGSVRRIADTVEYRRPQ